MILCKLLFRRFNFSQHITPPSCATVVEKLDDPGGRRYLEDVDGELQDEDRRRQGDGERVKVEEALLPNLRLY